MLNSLTSPEARGSFGIVAQEEAPNKTIPLNKTVISIDLNEMDLIPLFPFVFPLLLFLFCQMIYDPLPRFETINPSFFN
jgi:hypothetical protein